MSLHGVQNGVTRLLVTRMRERKMESWEPENAFQFSQTSRYSQKFCTLLSKMSVTGVQNGLRKRTKRNGRSPRPLCGLYCPISPISPMKTLCRAGVPNEVKRCPECVGNPPAIAGTVWQLVKNYFFAWRGSFHNMRRKSRITFMLSLLSPWIRLLKVMPHSVTRHGLPVWVSR